MENENIKVLIVDNNQDNLDSLKALIKHTFPGAGVLTALDGLQGLGLAASEDPDVIFLETVVSEMNGFEVCRRLKADKSLNDIPVVFVTPIKGDKVNRIAALECGAEAFLAKPVDESELAAQIRAMIKIKRAASVLRDEKRRLERLLEEKTLELRKSQKAEKAAVKERDKARVYLDAARVMIIAFDENAVITFINREGSELLGLGREEITGKRWFEHFIPERLRDGGEHEFYELLSGNLKSFEIHENAVLAAGGEERMVSWRCTVLRSEAGKITGVLSSGIDVTEQKSVLADLHESERSRSVLLSHIPGIAYRCDYDKDWTMKFLSEGCKALTGYEPNELINNGRLSYNELICPEYREAIWEEWKRVVDEKKSFRYEYEITTAGRERKWVLEMGQPIFGTNGAVEALEGIIIDITESKRYYSRIQHMNNHDALTGLFNRKYYEQAKQRMEEGDCLPLAVITADINGVRLVNDAFGHAAGDRIIMKTAELIKDCCREGDLLARTGGDEFSILLPKTDQDEAYSIINAIKDACATFNASIDDKAGTINLSLGFAVKQSVEQSIDDVLIEAEEFLYSRKLLERESHHNAILSSVMATMYARSHETEAHAERIAKISIMIAERINLPQKNLDNLQLLSILHDIGKVGIDDRILNKPGKLTEEEWGVMRKHPEIGYRMNSSRSPSIYFATMSAGTAEDIRED
jgi:diguanylate cyclase (GGDEF)-like protein/PAS domain S-box-containing protein